MKNNNLDLGQKLVWLKAKEGTPTNWVWNEKYNLISLADHPFLFIGCDKDSKDSNKFELVKWDSSNICVFNVK